MAIKAVRTGKFRLSKVKYDKNNRSKNDFEKKYKLNCPPTSVPYIAMPKTFVDQGKRNLDFIGCMALVYDNTEKTYSYAIVADTTVSSLGWRSVSDKCLENLSYKNMTPQHKYTIFLDTSDPPDWRGTVNDINIKIRVEGEKRFGEEKEESVDTAYGNAVSGVYSISQIDWKSLQYILITIDRNTTTKLDYEKLKDNNVAGIMIEAGYLYDVSHKTVSRYRNPKVNSQCLEASKNDMPFGLYCISRARSIEEAKKELYELSFIIRKYPPVLGMWVEFILVKSKDINDKIVEYYRDKLIQLGLIGKIGIFATEAELEKISWKDKHYEDWVLWLNKHVENTSDVQQLLTPQLFVV